MLLERDRVGARVDRVDERQNRLEVEMAELRAEKKSEALPMTPAYKLYLVLQPATQLVDVLSNLYEGSAPCSRSERLAVDISSSSQA